MNTFAVMARRGALRLPGSTGPFTAKIRGIFALMMASVVVLPAASAAADPVDVTVQFKWTHQSQFAGHYAADRLGFYRDEGLKVSFLPGGPDINPIEPVVAGAADLGIDSPTEIILSQALGKPVLAVATIFRLNPAVFISQEKLGITRPEHLAGKTIRIPGSDLLNGRTMLAQMGLAPGRYEVVDLPSKLDLFVEGKADAWYAYLPGTVATVEQAGLPINIIFPDDYGVHVPGDTLFARADYVRENPETVKRFLRATFKGWRYAIGHVEQVAGMVRAYRPDADLETETAKLMGTVPLLHPGDGRIGWIAPENWQRLIGTLRELGFLETDLDAADVYTTEFVKEIHGIK